MLILRNRVGHNDPVNGRCIESWDGIAAENAVSEQCINLGGTLLLEEFGCASDGVGSVTQIVNQNTNPVGNVAHKHHAGVSLFGKLDGTTFLKLG